MHGMYIYNKVFHAFCQVRGSKNSAGGSMRAPIILCEKMRKKDDLVK